MKDRPRTKAISGVKQVLFILVWAALLTDSTLIAVPINAKSKSIQVEWPMMNPSVYLDYEPVKELDTTGYPKEKEEIHEESSAYVEIVEEPVAEVIVPVGTTIEATETSQDERMEALVRATYILETGNGTSKLWNSQFNAGGIKCGAVYCAYQSREEGLTALRTLLTRYVANHGFDLKAIRDIYSESDDTALFTEIYNSELRKIREGV